jgi:hypothetical protein
MSQHFLPLGLTPQRELKQLGAQWLEAKDRGPHIRSNEITPAVPFLPFRWLPALQYVDKVTGPMREGYVMLKGTIVSSINILQSQSVAISGGTVEGNQTPWDNAQQWVLFTNHDGTTTPITLENSYYGYGPDIHSLLVPANGGEAQTVTMTTNDTSMGRLRPDGTLMEVGDSLTLSANVPIGCIMDDAGVDYRGQWLNYHPEAKILFNVYKQGAVDYPYLDTTAYAANYALAGGTHDFEDIKPTLDKLYRYFYAPTASMLNGSKIVPDEVGNPTVYVEPTFTGSVPPTVAEIQTGLDAHTWAQSQIVGSLDGVNPKQPHSLNDLHDTMLGSGMTGTDTGGVEAELFWFVHAVLTLGANVSPTIANIKSAIRKGHFGFATIWFHIV